MATGESEQLPYCPPGLNMEFQQPLLPEQVRAHEENIAKYRFTIPPSFAVHKQEKNGLHHDIPHANIHSCFSNIGFCTPFVKNTPGLSTHTSAQVGNFTAIGAQVKQPIMPYYIEHTNTKYLLQIWALAMWSKWVNYLDHIFILQFTSEVILDEGLYTVIAHGRVFIDDGAIKYDIARALKLEVLPAITDVVVSTDAKSIIFGVAVFGLVVNAV